MAIERFGKLAVWLPVHDLQGGHHESNSRRHNQTLLILQTMSHSEILFKNWLGRLRKNDLSAVPNPGFIGT